MAKPQPWHRLPDEPIVAFKYFQKYLDSEHRVVSELARELDMAPEGLYRYSGAFEWQERAAQYDGWMHKVAIAARARKVRDMNYRQQKVGKELQDLGRFIINTVASQISKNEVTLTKDDLAKGVRLIESGVTTERKAYGEPDQIQENRLTDGEIARAEDRLADQLLRDPEIRIKLAEASLETGDGESDPGEPGAEPTWPERLS